MSFIELKNVCKKYDKTDKNAVTDFNLSIGEKEFVAFVGPSISFFFVLELSDVLLSC